MDASNCDKHSESATSTVDELPSLLWSCTQNVLGTKQRFDLVDFNEICALFNKCSASKRYFECQVIALEAAIQEMLRGVHSLQNELNSVHKLPAEVLCAIFEFVCCQTDNCTLSAFCLSQVCRRWKTIALAYSPLWSHIIITRGNLDFLKECLKHSKGCSLRVTLDIHDDEEEGEPSAPVTEALKLLEGHSERIIIMDIDVPPSFDYRSITILTHPLSNLQCLRYMSKGNINPDLVVPGTFPSLKTLELGHMTRWPINLLVNTTSLTLSLPGRYREVQLSHLLAALSHSPQLRSLTISNCIIATHPGVSAFPLVALPGLKTFNVTSCHPVRILRFLHLPATLDAVICFPVPWYRGLDIFAVFPEDLSRLEFLHNLTSFKLLCINAHPTMTGQNTNGGSFRIEYPEKYMFSHNELFRSLSTISVSQITEFTSNGISWNMRLSHMLEKMTSLEILNVAASESDIGPAFRDLLPRAGCMLLCPKLQEINVTILSASMELAPFYAMTEMFKSRTGCLSRIRGMAYITDEDSDPPRNLVLFNLPREERFPSVSVWKSKFY